MQHQQGMWGREHSDRITWKRPRSDWGERRRGWTHGREDHRKLWEKVMPQVGTNVHVEIYQQESEVVIPPGTVCKTAWENLDNEQQVIHNGWNCRSKKRSKKWGYLGRNCRNYKWLYINYTNTFKNSTDCFTTLNLYKNLYRNRISRGKAWIMCSPVV